VELLWDCYKIDEVAMELLCYEINDCYPIIAFIIVLSPSLIVIIINIIVVIIIIIIFYIISQDDARLDMCWRFCSLASPATMEKSNSSNQDKRKAAMDEEEERPLKNPKLKPLICKQEVAATKIQAHFKGFRSRILIKRWICLADNVRFFRTMNSDVGAFIRLTPLNSVEHPQLRIG